MSAMETIAIKVMPEAAKAYRAASDTERKKMELLLSLRLLEAASAPQSLEDIMRGISKSAQARGLTEKKLADRMNNERRS